MQEAVAKVSFDRNYKADASHIGTEHPNAKQFFEQLKGELLGAIRWSDKAVYISFDSVVLVNYEAGGAEIAEDYRIWVTVPMEAKDGLQPQEILSAVVQEFQASCDDGVDGQFNVETLTVDGHEYVASDLVAEQPAPSGP